MPLPTLTRPLLILAALLVVAGLAAGVSAFVATTVSGQTTGYGVLPLRFRKAHQGAGIETDSLIGERCKTVQRQYTTDDPPNQASGEWGPANSSLGDPLSTGLPADRGDSNPDAVLERWVDLGAGNLRLMIECSYPDLFNQPNDRRIRHYLYATTQADAAAAPTAAEIKAALTGNNGIESANVVNNTLTGDDVHDQTLTANDFADESVDGRVVKHRSLPATVLVEDSITGNEIGPGAVGTPELKDGSVTLNKITSSLHDSIGLHTRSWGYTGFVSLRQHGSGQTNGFYNSGHPTGAGVSRTSDTAAEFTAPGSAYTTTGFWVDYRTIPRSEPNGTTQGATTGSRLRTYFVEWPLPSGTHSFTFSHGGSSGTATLTASGDNLVVTVSNLSGSAGFDDMAFHVWAEKVDGP